MNIIFCTNCGTQLSKNGNFCPGCGEEREAASFYSFQQADNSTSVLFNGKYIDFENSDVGAVLRSQKNALALERGQEQINYVQQQLKEETFFPPYSIAPQSVITGKHILKDDMNQKRNGKIPLLLLITIIVSIILTICLINRVFTLPLKLETGDTYHFGGFEWIVLSVDDDKALLLTKDIIELREYNNTNRPITWETSSIRVWLNESFYNRFSRDEQKQICTVYPMLDSPQYVSKSSGGYSNPEDAFSAGSWIMNPYFKNFEDPHDKQTTDKIFLLSIHETEGLYLRAYEDNFQANYRGLPNEWILRSPGENFEKIVYININGEVELQGIDVNQELGIRPALWLNLKGAKPN